MATFPEILYEDLFFCPSLSYKYKYVGFFSKCLWTEQDVIVLQGDRLRVEILSLSFEPSSHVMLDKSVQRVYVEYRLLGVPMETTETPMSLRKPREGEEIHYNFTRGENG